MRKTIAAAWLTCAAVFPLATNAANTAPLRITPAQVPGILARLPKYERLSPAEVAKRFGDGPDGAYRKLPGLLPTLHKLDPDFSQWSIADPRPNEIVRVTGRGELLLVSGKGAVAAQGRAIAVVVDLKRRNLALLEQGLDAWLLYGMRDVTMAAIALKECEEIASPRLADMKSAAISGPPAAAASSPPLELATVAQLIRRGPVDWSALDAIARVKWASSKPTKQGSGFARSGTANVKGLDLGSVSFHGDSRRAESASIDLEGFDFGGDPKGFLDGEFPQPARVATVRGNCPDGTDDSVFKLSWPDGPAVFIHVSQEHAYTASQTASTSIELSSKEENSWKCR